jgi:hypothetical protein
MIASDALSERLLHPLTADEAAVLRHDSELRAGVSDAVDVDGIIDNLLLEPMERLRGAADGVPEQTLLDIIDQLERRNVRYVLIGGLAGALYGSCLGTSDFDICHARDRVNLCALADLLRDIGAEFRRLPQFAPPRLEARTFITETDFVFTTRLGKFDLIGEFSGVGRFVQAIHDAVTVQLGRWTIPVLSLPKLLSAKRSTGRPKDAAVSLELELVARMRERLDVLAQHAS